ncbi:NCS2 family permease [Calothrix sp. 336/3]|uniref:NCS2 family permease n=1 Tax=Calothrix sp. 336/3 TaxID=1337936 RepID=UPI00269D7679
MSTLTLKRLFLAGEIDGFLALALENFVQVMLILSLCQGVLGFTPDMIYERILPGVALSVFLSNFFYGWLGYNQSKQLSRYNMTALPSGVNIVSLLAHIFLVMLPVKTNAIAQGVSTQQAAEMAWQAGIVACLASGFIKLAGLWAIKSLQRFIPLAAHLSTLGGIALTFMAMGFFMRTFAYPVVSLVPLGIILLAYFGKVKFAIPAGLLAILFGTALAWGTGLMHWDNSQLIDALKPIGIYTPGIWLGKLWQGRGFLIEYQAVIVPLAIFDFINGFQNLESAKAAGDSYPKMPALMGHGIFTIVAAICGSCFPTTIYTGHPGWKAMGAGFSYSFLSGIFAAILSLTGTASLLGYFIPLEGGMAVLIAIGICIVAQCFTVAPVRHAPAVVIGLLPAVAAWGTLMVKVALQIAEMGTKERPLTPELITQFQLNNLFIDGGFALEQGYILTSIILASVMVHIIERNFHLAAIWTLIGSALSWFGLIHGYRWTETSTVGVFAWGAGGAWAIGYCLLGILFFYAHYQANFSRDVE